ncbi:MAG: response regulator [Candidatus Hydrogenedentota bacterium]
MPTANANPNIERPAARRVLLVEDDVPLTQLVREKLAPYGYNVQVHHQARSAYQAIAQTRPHLLVLDVMLGDGAGYQVARRVRSDAGLYLTPILFMSTLGDKREVEYALRQGGDAYLTKPFTLQDLVQRLDELQRLSEALHKRNPLTGLYGIERLKREVDRRLFLEESFALCAASIDYLDAYTARHGEQAGLEVAACLAHSIAHVMREQGYPHHLSHASPTHFYFFAPADSYKRTCRHVVHRFAEESSRFYTAEELAQKYMVASKHQGVYAGYPLMEARLCVASSAHKRFACAREAFTQLEAAREHSHDKEESRVFTFKQGKKW